MSVAEPAASAPDARLLAQGEDWRVTEVICHAGPADRPFEEKHDWMSVAAVLGGTFTYRSARGRALMTPGSLLLGNAGTCFECGHPHGTGDCCVAFHFAPALLEETAGALKGVARARFAACRIPPVDSLLPVVAAARALTVAPDALRAEEVALELSARALALDQAAGEAAPGARDERRIAEAVRFMAAHHAEPLAIGDLASTVGMRRRRFASVFRQVVGVTPYLYVLNLRLEAAARRLREERSTVLAIALDVGFGDLSEFTRRFRAKFGKPPAQYRRDAGVS